MDKYNSKVNKSSTPLMGMLILKYLFCFRGNIGRLEFAINIIAAIAIYLIPFIVIASAPRPDPALLDLYEIFFSITFIAAFVSLLSSAIRRCRNLGISPWWLLATLVPFVNIGLAIVLLFSPGWAQNGGSHLFSMLQIIAECDGPVNSKETQEYERFCKLVMDEKAAVFAKAQFSKGCTHPLFGFKYHLNHYIKSNNASVKPFDYRMIAGQLTEMAEADGPISEKESILLNLAVTKFGIDQLLPPGFEELLGMLAKLAKVDGSIAKEEIAVIDQFFQDAMQLNSQQRKKAIEGFQKAKDSTIAFNKYAKQFSQTHHDHPDLIENVFDLLVEVALADEIIKPEEAALLEEAAKIFNISHHRYDHGDQQQSGYRQSSSSQKNEASYAKVLGLNPGYTFSDIKKQYRILMAKNHPDKVANLSDVIREVAENETKKIIEAYTFLKDRYS